MFEPVFYIIFLLFIASSLKAQENLVPNSSFEEYYQCPYGEDQLMFCKNWIKANLATSDYFNACQTNTNTGVSVPKTWSGYQTAFDGNAYTGIIIYEGTTPTLSEYTQCKLIEPLIACKSYQIRFWTSLGDKCPNATNTLGARLDKEAIKKISPYDYDGFELPPHVGVDYFITDTTNWILVSGIYTAEGGEQYLTIGRFIDTSIYDNYSVPFVSVNCNSCTSSGSPSQYYIDSVSVMEIDVKSPYKESPNILTANDDGINDYWLPIGNCSDIWNCTIYNRWGNVVFEFNQTNKGWNGKDNNGKVLTEGVYYYILQENKNKKTGFIQLIR